jgi:type VI secretion system protein ImpG
LFNRYFQDEIANLRELGAEFSKAHPAVAPMLSGRSADPDVERLLEGVAFLTALLREKLDDEFPEIIHELVQLIWPHYLRPIPAASIVAFTPKPTLQQTMTIPAGVQVASVPVEGTPCLFQTCYPVTIDPLEILEAAYIETAGKPSAISLTLELRNISLDEWNPDSLRLYLSGETIPAPDLFLLLRQYLREIVIRPLEGVGEAIVLPPDLLEPVGYSDDECLLPYPGNSFPGYRIIQEYFILPEKYLFLDLKGWERWRNRGPDSRFEITFVLDALPFAPSGIRKGDFVLGATPVINTFPHDADPIRLDHRQTEYRVRPTGANDDHFQVYSVDKVIGFAQGSAHKTLYSPFEVFTPDPEANPVFHTRIKNSPVRSGFDMFLSVVYPPGAKPSVQVTLSIQLQCTNGYLPEGIRMGDICIPTGSTPEYVDFKNLRTPTSNILPPLGTNLLWRLLSHLSLNYASLAKAENLRAILDLYNFEKNRDRPAFLANQKRINGIEKVFNSPSNRLVSGAMMRGMEVRMEARQDHFSSVGDLYLFGSILDFFLGSYASMNTFTRFSVKEMLKGDIFQWPARVGDRLLL